MRIPIWLLATLILIPLAFVGQQVYRFGRASGDADAQLLLDGAIPVEKRSDGIYIDTRNVVDKVVVNNGRQKTEFLRKESPGAIWYQEGAQSTWIEAPRLRPEVTQPSFQPLQVRPRAPTQAQPCGDQATPCGESGGWATKYRPVRRAPQ